jgi:hypothetical protein
MGISLEMKKVAIILMERLALRHDMAENRFKIPA